MQDPKPIDSAAAGVAALSVCESLLLALGDQKILSEEEIVGVISDAANAHRFVAGSEKDTPLHDAVVVLLDKIIAGGNSVRRT